MVFLAIIGIASSESLDTLMGRLLAMCGASEILLIKFDSRSKLYAFM
jgi:hypothetical protein